VKIVSLKSENIKRLKAVEITPNGQDVVLVGGRNAQGKSSVLDSIEYALGGKPSVERPIRDGEKKGRVVLETETLRVTRTFTEKGSSLVVEDLNGGKHSSPQATLDKLFGALAFDPLAFSRQPAREQAETLKALVGIDLTPLDDARKITFDDRTMVNREVKALEAQVAAMPAETVEPVSVAELSAELQRRNEQNGKWRELQAEVASLAKSIGRTAERIAEIDERIAALQVERKKQEQDLFDFRAELECVNRARETTAEMDTAEIVQQITQAEAINSRAARCRQRRELETQLAGKRNEADGLTAKLAAIDDEKRLSLAEAKFPVPGLAFDDTGVTFGGVPFAQCSSAEQLRVSVGIGLATNKDLRVMLIREGSLLDADSMEIIAEMARAADAQFWVEVVSNDGAGCTVVIEDGMVAA
jgi:DNA repair exonuclease SbcCD ATPase subunit